MFDNCISQTSSEISPTRITVVSREISYGKSLRIWHVNMFLFSAMESSCYLRTLAVNRWVFRRPSGPILRFFCFHFLLWFLGILSWGLFRLPFLSFLLRSAWVPSPSYCKYCYYLLLTISDTKCCKLTDSVQCFLKANSHTACRSHAAPMPFPCHAVPLRV